MAGKDVSKPQITFKVPANPQTVARLERNGRIAEARANPKASPTNKDVYALLLDVAEELADLNSK